MKTLKDIIAFFRDIIYPEGAICAGCGKISDGNYLCPSCQKELMYGDLLESWDTRRLGDAFAWSMRPHRDLPRRLVLRLKHQAEAPAAQALAGILQTRPDAFPGFPPETVVTWVPAPKTRIRERCIDHGQLLAEAVAAELKLKCEQLLQRRGNDSPQARLNQEQRQQNLKNAFAPKGKISFPVLLVDDVLTTGTTALRCIAALKEGGAKEITVLTVTRAVK